MNEPTPALDHRLDLQRRQRLGMVEAVWGEHKSAEQIAAIASKLWDAGEVLLVTRVSPQKGEAVAALLETPALRYHSEARCLTFATPASSEPGASPQPGEAFAGAATARVAVLGAGSSDLGVASEALLALQCHGVGAELVLDVGVAGLHRLLDQLPLLRSMDVLIACAGMEGALPTVLAGLLPQPVIGVPVAVGYGVSAGGMAALHGMLASCAPGLTVVNVDNGYGAAMAALRILRGAGAGGRP
ncbi:nickel pincer cofactor biosynthesis protein LarB [Cyanobium sp. LEGE 06113]|uniref:nickel pincer cofactor biosynthesis protein LarB n=1 Tax=Cyanobium sp. LEGE 06113 TaxID=1297573 RepID=UPI00187E0049|nr:nickel pincer cofactor biosynthesis protein LarB [Cyanobium sp. LEGE 06113]MBE9155029.1 nickel pincer cofactor biosynthesis protein LarB [Cyanobium sp. LEGE 06113]